MISSETAGDAESPNRAEKSLSWATVLILNELSIGREDIKQSKLPE